MTLRFSLPWPNCAGTYRIVDTVSGRFYIGSTINLRRRWLNHVWRFTRGDHPNPIMQRIWNAGRDRLVFRVVEEMPGARPEVRLAAEQRLLDRAKVGRNRRCMNILPVAGSHEGRKRSAATIERLRLANIGRTFSAETRAKMRAAKLGGKLSAEHRAKIGAKSVGRPGPRHSAAQIAKWRKHTADDVHSLKQRVQSGQPILHAARALGMSNAVAHRILKGESYAGV